MGIFRAVAVMQNSIDGGLGSALPKQAESHIAHGFESHEFPLFFAVLAEGVSPTLKIQLGRVLALETVLQKTLSCVTIRLRRTLPP